MQKIAVMAMKVGQKTTPRPVELTLENFFVKKAHEFQENTDFPFAFTQCGFATNCAILEGGCQFSFDRKMDAPIGCISCFPSNCTCGKARYALQDFNPTRIYILDVDLNPTRLRDYQGFCKYHSLTLDEEQELRCMECRLTRLDSIVFYYRTKCNGFRIGFDAKGPIVTSDRYEVLAKAAEEMVKNCTPDRKIESGAWFNIDRISGKDGSPRRAYAYWSYPRVYHPVWLNPKRESELE